MMLSLVVLDMPTATLSILALAALQLITITILGFGIQMGRGQFSIAVSKVNSGELF